MTPQYDKLSLDHPYPGPLPPDEGMVAILNVNGDGAAGLTLLAAIGTPSPAEVAQLRTGPMRLAIVPSGPVTWLVLSGAAVTFDAPYSLGLEAAATRAAIAAALERDAGAAEGPRRLLQLISVDHQSGRVVGLRAATVSHGWWRTLTGAVLAGRDAAAPEIDAQRAADLARWPDNRAMLTVAAAVERLGAA